MTTSRIAIRREVARELPIFAQDSLVAETVGVVSLEVRRAVNEPMAAAVAIAAGSLGRALGEITNSEMGKLHLVAVGLPFARPGRVGAYLAQRDKLWSALERFGVVLPPGRRVDVDMSHSDDTIQFCGVIEFEISDLSVALEVTRQERAVCVGRIGEQNGLGLQDSLSWLEMLPEDPKALFPVAVRRITKGIFVARSFGAFDDHIVGSDVFAENEILDKLEAIFVPSDSGT